jgi:hypothetical protein
MVMEPSSFARKWINGTTLALSSKIVSCVIVPILFPRGDVQILETGVAEAAQSLLPIAIAGEVAGVAEVVVFGHFAPLIKSSMMNRTE